MRNLIKILIIIFITPPLFSQIGGNGLCPINAYCSGNNVLIIVYKGNNHGVLISYENYLIDSGKPQPKPPLLGFYYDTYNDLTYVGYQLPTCPYNSNYWAFVYEDGNRCIITQNNKICPDNLVCDLNRFSLHFEKLPSDFIPYEIINICNESNTSGTYTLESYNSGTNNLYYPVGFCNSITQKMTIELNDANKTKCTYNSSGILCNPPSSFSNPVCEHLKCGASDDKDCKVTMVDCEDELNKLVQQRWELLDGCDFWNGDCGTTTTISRPGKVFIGSTFAFSLDPDFMLTVCSPYTNSGILTTKYKVNRYNWPDYVFDKDYNLISLYDLEKYIKENKKLPKTISQQQVIKDKGIVIEDLTIDQQEKIEEIYLHLIQLDKKIKSLENK